jgi:hypothetical protein
MNKAIADFSKAIKLKSDDAEAYHYRGIAFHLSGINIRHAKTGKKLFLSALKKQNNF